jgi:iron(III) transport system ATP-binding protein
VADRIVVMNHGVIEQVGTPLEVYREPASAFVADFVGKVNRLRAVAEGDHWYRLGNKRLQCRPEADAGCGATGEVAIYLRPEDRVIDGLRDDDPLRCAGTVRHVEFLGGNCLAEIAVDGIPDQPMQLQFSLNQMDEFALREGAPLDFALRADRLRVFPLAAA